MATNPRTRTAFRPRPRGASVLALALIATSTAPGGAEPACLAGAAETAGMSVVDARTIAAGGRPLHLIGVESFALLLGDGEAAQAEAAMRQRVEELVAGRSVRSRVLRDSPDRYGRLPVLVAVDGEIVQETIARDGLAIAFAGGGRVPCFDRILAAEDEARRSRRGYWAELPLPSARPDLLKPYVGRFAIFEGKVISVGNRRARTYLNFGGFWSEDVTAEIHAGDRAALGGEAALADLAGRQVRIRGFVEERSGPVVVVSSPNQLEVLGEAAEARGSMP